MHVAYKHIEGLPLAAPVAKKPTAKEKRHAEMHQAKRRREYLDFEAALKDPEIQELIKKVQAVSPGWQPKFKS